MTCCRISNRLDAMWTPESPTDLEPPSVSVIRKEFEGWELRVPMHRIGSPNKGLRRPPRLHCSASGTTGRGFEAGHGSPSLSADDLEAAALRAVLATRSRATRADPDPPGGS